MCFSLCGLFTAIQYTFNFSCKFNVSRIINGSKIYYSCQFTGRLLSDANEAVKLIKS